MGWPNQERVCCTQTTDNPSDEPFLRDRALSSYLITLAMHHYRRHWLMIKGKKKSNPFIRPRRCLGVSQSGGHLSGETLADGLDDGVVFDVIAVVGLQLDGNAGQGLLEALLGGGVNHLGLRHRVSGLRVIRGASLQGRT